MEYLAYAGGNGSAWSNDSRYYNHDCEGTVFGKPCLVLKEVCWMDPWARLECVPVPRPDSQIDVYIYHMYGENFRMDNDFKIFAGKQEDSDLTLISNIRWPLEGSD